MIIFTIPLPNEQCCSCFCYSYDCKGCTSKYNLLPWCQAWCNMVVSSDTADAWSGGSASSTGATPSRCAGHQEGDRGYSGGTDSPLSPVRYYPAYHYECKFLKGVQKTPIWALWKSAHVNFLLPVTSVPYYGIGIGLMGLLLLLNLYLVRNLAIFCEVGSDN